MPAVCAINLNARTYDPTIGHMMSADIRTQFYDDLQDLHRYSYVNNGPLSALDPSGYDECSPSSPPPPAPPPPTMLAVDSARAQPQPPPPEQPPAQMEVVCAVANRLPALQSSRCYRAQLIPSPLHIAPPAIPNSTSA